MRGPAAILAVLLLMAGVVILLYVTLSAVAECMDASDLSGLAALVDCS